MLNSLLQLITDAAPLLVAIFVLGIVGIVLTWIVPKEWTRRRPNSRSLRERLFGRRKRSAGAVALEAIDREDFIVTMNQTPEAYARVTRVIQLIIVVVGMLLIGAWGATIALLIVATYVRREIPNGRIEKRRNRLLADEVIPTAQAIAGSLSAGMSLSQAMSDVSRAAQPTALQSALRRALSDSRGLEEGLKTEEQRARQDTAREFFEVLADGASVARQTAATAETLDKFAELSMQRRTAFQAAQRATSQARNTRSVLTIMVPGVYVLGLTLGGGDALLKTFLGNVITLLILGFVFLAYSVTNSIIRGVTKGF